MEKKKNCSFFQTENNQSQKALQIGAKIKCHHRQGHMLTSLFEFHVYISYMFEIEQTQRKCTNWHMNKTMYAIFVD